MRSTRWWVVPGLLVVALGACSGSKPALVNMGPARSEILQLATQYRLTVGEVRCPEEVPRRKGYAFFCTVDLDGVPLRLVLRETNDQGATHIAQTQAVVLTSRVEGFIAEYANAHGHPVAAVSCGKATVRTEVPGTKVTCVVTYANGSKGKGVVGVKDTRNQMVIVSLTP